MKKGTLRGLLEVKDTELKNWKEDPLLRKLGLCSGTDQVSKLIFKRTNIFISRGQIINHSIVFVISWTLYFNFFMGGFCKGGFQNINHFTKIVYKFWLKTFNASQFFEISVVSSQVSNWVLPTTSPDLQPQFAGKKYLAPRALWVPTHTHKSEDATKTVLPTACR